MAYEFLTADMIDTARLNGEAWAEAEIENWELGHNDTMAGAPAWSRGQYCGDRNPTDDMTDEQQDEYETAIDDFAEAAWDAAREAAE